MNADQALDAFYAFLYGWLSPPLSVWTASVVILGLTFLAGLVLGLSFRFVRR